MYVRLELCTRPAWKDPEAELVLSLISKVNPKIHRKIRWARILRVYWMELQAQRDQTVAAIQSAFGDSVLTWAFTGDLVPSAAGATGTLQDLMHASPFRPGVFHGIEKRTRLDRLDAEGAWALETIQCALGRKQEDERVMSGFLLLLEGPELKNEDLEWISRQCFGAAASESWTIFTEEELKRNSRFQSDQVAKYINPVAVTVSERWLQRAKTRLWIQGAKKDSVQFTQYSSPNDRKQAYAVDLINQQIPKAWIRKSTSKGICLLDFDDEELLVAGMHFSNELKVSELGRISIESAGLSYGVNLEAVTVNTQIETGERTEWILQESAEILDEFAKQCDVPVLWNSDELTNKKPFTVMNWYGMLPKEKNGIFFDFEPVGIEGKIWFIGNAAEKKNLSRDLLSLKRLERIQNRLRDQGHVLAFFPMSNCTLKEKFKDLMPVLQGANIQLRGSLPDANRFWEQTVLDGFIWVVHPESQELVADTLKKISVTSQDLGATEPTGGLHVLHEGKVVLEVPQFQPSEGSLRKVDYEVGKMQVNPEFKRRRAFNAQSLYMNTKVHPLSRNAPVISRPRADKSSAVVTTGGVCGLEMNPFENLKYFVRRSLAAGAQFGSEDSVLGIQLMDLTWRTSTWDKISQWMIDLGIPVLNYMKNQNAKTDGESAEIGYVNVIGKISDVRNCRLEEFKVSGMNIYWFGWNGEVDTGFDEKRVYSWMGGTDGRLQHALQGCIAIPNGQWRETLVRAIAGNQMGADIAVQDSLGQGFLTLVSDADRFPLEEEWRTYNISCLNIGRTNQSPNLIIRVGGQDAQMISVPEWFKGWKEGRET